MDRFPSLVESAIGDFAAKTPDEIRARDAAEQIELRGLRIRRIRFIEDYFISRTAAHAALHIKWKAQAPFCLLLRSFSLQHQFVEPASSEAISDPYEKTWLDASDMSGGRLLKPLSKILGERIGLITLANPDEWLPNRMIDGPFSSLVVQHDRWQTVVAQMIAASQLIIVHKAAGSRGVDHELNQIRTLGRQAQTIVVREPEPLRAPNPDAHTWEVLALLDRNERRREAQEAARAGKAVFPPDPTLNGFLVLEWQKDKKLLAQLANQIERRLSVAVPRYFDIEPPDTGSYAETTDQRQLLVVSQSAYEQAGKLVAGGELRIAEELFFHSIGASAAANNTGGRASAYLELGKLFLLKQWDAKAALIPLEYASSHFLVMDAGDYALHAIHLYSAAHLLSGNRESAKNIISAGDHLKNSEDNRKWLVRFWDLIARHSPESDTLQFIAELSL